RMKPTIGTPISPAAMPLNPVPIRTSRLRRVRLGRSEVKSSVMFPSLGGDPCDDVGYLLAFHWPGRHGITPAGDAFNPTADNGCRPQRLIARQCQERGIHDRSSGRAPFSVVAMTRRAVRCERTAAAADISARFSSCDSVVLAIGRKRFARTVR